MPCPAVPLHRFFLKIIIYLFIFGCVGSSFLCESFLHLRQAGATLHRGARASRCHGLSCCGAQAPDAQAQQLWLTGPAAPRHVGSSQTRARTRVPCIGRQTLNHCATREVPQILIDWQILCRMAVPAGAQGWQLHQAGHKDWTVCAAPDLTLLASKPRADHADVVNYTCFPFPSCYALPRSFFHIHTPITVFNVSYLGFEVILHSKWKGHWDSVRKKEKKILRNVENREDEKGRDWENIWIDYSWKFP